MTKYTYLQLVTLTHDIRGIVTILNRELSNCMFDFNTEHTDGRRNSVSDEDVISDHIITKFPNVFRKSEPRELGDIWFGTYPINIKVVKDRPSQANNLVGTTHFVKYVLNDPRCRDHPSIATSLINTPHDRILKHYGVIIVTKETSRAWVGNFDEIPEQNIKVNPSNGIQITWPSGHIKRSNQEYRGLMESKILELMRKWAEPLKVWEREIERRANEQRAGTILHDQ